MRPGAKGAPAGRALPSTAAKSAIDPTVEDEGARAHGSSEAGPSGTARAHVRVPLPSTAAFSSASSEDSQRQAPRAAREATGERQLTAWQESQEIGWKMAADESDEETVFSEDTVSETSDIDTPEPPNTDDDRPVSLRYATRVAIAFLLHWGISEGMG